MAVKLDLDMLEQDKSSESLVDLKELEVVWRFCYYSPSVGIACC